MAKFAKAVDRMSVESSDRWTEGSDQSMTLADVARDLLGLDVSALAEMDPRARVLGEEGDASQGFNVLVRRALGRALAMVDEPEAVVRLMSDRAARADGWPDARTANLAMVVTWVIANEDRDLRGLATVPMMSADDLAVGPSGPAVGTGGDDLLTGSDLLAALTRPISMFGDSTPADREGRLATSPERLCGAPVASTNATIREVLGLDPRELAGYSDRRNYQRSVSSFDADPERAGRNGLLRLLKDALVQLRVMTKREVDAIRLISDVEAREEGWADSRPLRFATLVAAALLHGDPREVRFLPARDPRPESEALLLAMARDVYFFGSETAFQGFVLLCDDNVRFGVDFMHDKARRLLWRVSKEHDPDCTRFLEMPEGISSALTLVQSEDIRRSEQLRDGSSPGGGVA